MRWYYKQECGLLILCRPTQALLNWNMQVSEPIIIFVSVPIDSMN